MADLITSADARVHLRLTATQAAQADIAADLAKKVTEASEIILSYIKRPEVSATWNATTAPKDVQAAVKMVLSDLWEHRAGSATDDVVLSFAAKSLLSLYWTPALA